MSGRIEILITNGPNTETITWRNGKRTRKITKRTRNTELCNNNVKIKEDTFFEFATG